MKINIYNIALAASMLTVASCSEHWTPPVGSDGSVALGSMVVDVKENANVIVSSGSRAAADVNSFQVTIYDKTGAEAGSWVYGQMPEIVTLAAGDGYVVKVKSHDVEKAAWEMPYYYGESKSFTVEKNKITEVGTVTAEFKSVKVTVEFTDELKAVVSDDVKVVIEANDEGLITFTKKEIEEGTAAYFEYVEGSTTMVARFAGSINGNATENKAPFTDVAPGQHRIVRYGVKVGPDVPKPDGSITPGGISLDTEIVEVDVNGNVTVVDPTLDPSDRPGHEDPENPDQPGPDEPTPPTPGDDVIEFTKGADNDNFNLEGVNTVKKGDDSFGEVVVNINAEKGVKNLFVTIKPGDEGFSAALADLGLLEPFDLANPGDLEASLGPDGLNLPIKDAVAGKTVVLFDISGFIPMLSAFVGEHSFELRTVDSDNNEKSMTLVFKVVE